MDQPTQSGLLYQLDCLCLSEGDTILSFKPSLCSINHCRCQLNLQLPSITHDIIKHLGFFNLKKVTVLMKNFLPGKLSQSSLYSNSRLNPVSKTDCIFSFLGKKKNTRTSWDSFQIMLSSVSQSFRFVLKDTIHIFAQICSSLNHINYHFVYPGKAVLYYLIFYHMYTYLWWALSVLFKIWHSTISIGSINQQQLYKLLQKRVCEYKTSLILKRDSYSFL